MSNGYMKKSISWYQLWKRIGKQTLHKTRNTKVQVLIDGELVEFICDCGCSSQAASNYCPDCGTKMDNSDIEERIQEAIHKAI